MQSIAGSDSSGTVLFQICPDYLQTRHTYTPSIVQITHCHILNLQYAMMRPRINAAPFTAHCYAPCAVHTKAQAHHLTHSCTAARFVEQQKASNDQHYDFCFLFFDPCHGLRCHPYLSRCLSPAARACDCCTATCCECHLPLLLPALLLLHLPSRAPSSSQLLRTRTLQTVQ